MTLNDIEKMDKELLTVSDVKKVLGMTDATIRNAAREAPDKLGFPVIVAGHQVRIPRRAFIRFMKGASK